MTKSTDHRDHKDFFQQVYAVVELIPEGRATSYGAIAAYLGAPGAARMVGWAMNASHKITNKIPAHRVLNRNGILTGKHHFSESDTMEKALQMEGIIIKNNQVLNWKDIFWDPQQELSL